MDLDVGPVAHGGHCVARHDGRVIFVRHTLPGERVRARVIEDGGGSYCLADAMEVLAPAPERVPPPCVFAGPGRCGGCDFQHVEVAAQRDLKAQVIAEQLARLAGLSTVDVVVEEMPGGPLGWRTRMQFAVDATGRAGLRKHRSHDVVRMPDCPIAHPGLRAADILAGAWPGQRAVEVAVSGTGQRAALGHSGPERLTERAAGREWQVAAASFWQVHPRAADTFAEAVLDFLRPVPGERAVDLYGGVGLFAGVLAEAVGPGGAVLCVEGSAVAAADAAANLAGTPWATVRCARVDPALIVTLTADIVVLDPPRTGAGRELCQAVVALSPRAVAYVACDPAALARDVRTFLDTGWELARLRAFDAFPMTHHVECIALLVPGPVTTGLVAGDA